MAFIGNTINSSYVENSFSEQTLEYANKAHRIYQDEYDPAKKSIVVIGASTSSYSFSRGDDKIHEFSFVDLLKKDINVLNFSSYTLENVYQIKILLKFLESKNLKFDLIILENFKYLAEPITDNGVYNLALLRECLIYNSSLKKMCSKIDWQDGNISNEYSANPCLKKYHELLLPIYKMISTEKVKAFDKLLSCGKSSNTEVEIQKFIISNYHYGYAKEVRISFGHLGIDLNPDLQTGLDFNPYKEDELIFLNKYIKDFVETFSINNLMLIPSYSRNEGEMRSVPMFRDSEKNIHFLEMAQDITKISREKNFKFKDIFLDGAHYDIEIHKKMAEKILKTLK